MPGYSKQRSNRKTIRYKHQQYSSAIKQKRWLGVAGVHLLKKKIKRGGGGVEGGKRLHFLS